GEHDVGVREQRERRAVARAADARDEVRALGRAGEERALDAGRLEVVAQELSGRRLVPRRVGRVDADQPLEQIDDVAQRRLPVTSRYSRLCTTSSPCQSPS